MSTHLNQYLTYRALARRFENRDLVDYILRSNDADSIKIEGKGIKNMCAKVPAQMVEEVDRVCGVLDISKRDFIEMAVVGALQDARGLIEEYSLEGESEA